MAIRAYAYFLCETIDELKRRKDSANCILSKGIKDYDNSLSDIKVYKKFSKIIIVNYSTLELELVKNILDRELDKVKRINSIYKEEIEVPVVEATLAEKKEFDINEFMIDSSD